MSAYAKMLDAIVAQDQPAAQKPPVIERLDLPGLERWEEGRIWSKWKVNPEMFHAQGAVFGGYLSAMADSQLGLATLSVLGDGEGFTTSDLRISFFRTVHSGHLDIEAAVVHRGRSMIHVEATFTRDDGKLAAKASATQVVIPGGPPEIESNGGHAS